MLAKINDSNFIESAWSGWTSAKLTRQARESVGTVVMFDLIVKAHGLLGHHITVLNQNPSFVPLGPNEVVACVTCVCVPLAILPRLCTCKRLLAPARELCPPASTARETRCLEACCLTQSADEPRSITTIGRPAITPGKPLPMLETPGLEPTTRLGPRSRSAPTAPSARRRPLPLAGPLASVTLTDRHSVVRCVCAANEGCVLILSHARGAYFAWCHLSKGPDCAR
jgi:hypothetical protein